MLKQNAIYITPDEHTTYLVGPEGVVWLTPSLGGESFILAARNDLERSQAARFVGDLLQMGLVPYGLPVNQQAIVAMFGGSPIRDCTWLPWPEAPQPVGDPGDTLPTQAAVIA